MWCINYVPVFVSFYFSLSPSPQNKDSTGDEKLTAKQLGDYYTKLTEDFPIVSIEDGFDQVCIILHRILCLQTGAALYCVCGVRA